MHTRTLFAAITILLLFISASFAIVLAEGPPPGVDTAQRDDVVPEDDGGGASGAVDEGSEGRLPDVDNAQRDDVVEEEEGATGSAANAPAPTGLTVTSDTDDSVSLSWNTVTDAGAYKVEYRRSGSISWLHAGYVYSSTSDTVDGLDWQHELLLSGPGAGRRQPLLLYIWQPFIQRFGDDRRMSGRPQRGSR